MEKQALHAGLEKIKEMFSDDDPVMDITKKLSVPLGALALIGGGILAKRKFGGPSVSPEGVTNLIKKHRDKILKDMRAKGVEVSTKPGKLFQKGGLFGNR